MSKRRRSRQDVAALSSDRSACLRSGRLCGRSGWLRRRFAVCVGVPAASSLARSVVAGRVWAFFSPWPDPLSLSGAAFSKLALPPASLPAHDFAWSAPFRDGPRAAANSGSVLRLPPAAFDECRRPRPVLHHPEESCPHP